MSRMRQRIAERLKQSQNAAASLTTFNEIDMSSLMSMRSAYKDDVLKKTGVKLGFMSAFARASVIALQEIPAANASIEGEGAGDTIVYRDYVDLSVAVATPKGLVTPVLRNAEAMSFVDIERAISELAKKARDNKLTLEDMAGGSFTMFVTLGYRSIGSSTYILSSALMVGFTARCTERLSSTSPKPPSSVCTPSRTLLLSLMERLSSDLSWSLP